MPLATVKKSLKMSRSVVTVTPDPVIGRYPLGDCTGAIVTGADYRGLGIVRSLGRRGIPVWVLREEGHFLGAASRYAARSLRWPAGDEYKQVDFLVDLASREGLKGWALFPTTDELVMLLAHNHKTLSAYYHLTIPPWEMLQRVCDKRLLYQVAEDIGLHQPWAFFPRTRDDLARLSCRFPVIIKPALRAAFNRFTKDKAWPAMDRASLLRRYDEAAALVGSDMVMVQEFIPGWGEAQFSYAALCGDGQPIASVVARRTRQFPMDFGRFSTYVETVNEPEVVEAAVRLLASSRFTGIAEVEFKRDSRDGHYKLLDVNPRVWGWHTLGQRAGVDFPHLLWLLLKGERIPETHARTGERWMRFWADLPMAIYEILKGRLSVSDYVRSLQVPVESAIFAWDDPLPGLLGLPSLLNLFGKRLPLKEGI
jgi:D-aspartate ligase